MTYTGCGFCSSHECAIRGCQKFKYQQPYVAPTYQWPAPPPQGGKGGRRAYNDTDFDVLALVALDIRAIAYLKLAETRQTIHLNRDKFLRLSDVGRVL